MLLVQPMLSQAGEERIDPLVASRCGRRHRQGDPFGAMLSRKVVSELEHDPQQSRLRLIVSHNARCSCGSTGDGV